MREVDKNGAGQREQLVPAESHSVVHDWTDDGSLSTTVVKAVAAVSGRRPTELDTLHSVLDPDALDALFGPIQQGRPADSCVAFTLSNHRIRVYADGLVVVVPPRGNSVEDR